jgi:U3 small nucleolar RNA-associated protein MPP10
MSLILYQQDYLKQKEKVNPTNEDEEEEEKETPEQIEIKKMMKNLFLKLDAISNYHYTPRIVRDY